jgi:hypothetical protein
MNHSKQHQNWTDPFVRPTYLKRDMKFGTWNISSLYRLLYTTAARELARYKLDLVGVQQVWWDTGSRVRAGNYNLFD